MVIARSEATGAISSDNSFAGSASENSFARVSIEFGKTKGREMDEAETQNNLDRSATW